MANDFLPFASAGGANVMTQAAYSALAARTAGFSAGTAQSAQLNKVWRQSSLIAAAVAQAINDITGQDVLDDGTTAGIVATFKAAIAAGSNIVTGNSLNLKAAVPAASATATFTADVLVVSTSLSGNSYRLSGFNKTINLAITGVGGMDTGLATLSGFVAVYAIYNPTTGVSALLATNATLAVQPEIYGGANMPAGYTASALVSVWGINNVSRFFNIGFQFGRRIETGFIGLLDINTDSATLIPVSIAIYVPLNAKTLSGQLVCGNNNAGGTSVAMDIAGSSTGIGGKYFNAFVLSTGTAQTPFYDMPILTAQTMYTIRTIGAGPARYQVLGSNYTF